MSKGPTNLPRPKNGTEGPEEGLKPQSSNPNMKTSLHRARPGKGP